MNKDSKISLRGREREREGGRERERERGRERAERGGEGGGREGEIGRGRETLSFTFVCFFCYTLFFVCHSCQCYNITPLIVMLKTYDASS